MFLKLIFLFKIPKLPFTRISKFLFLFLIESFLNNFFLSLIIKSQSKNNCGNSSAINVALQRKKHYLIMRISLNN